MVKNMDVPEDKSSVKIHNTCRIGTLSLSFPNYKMEIVTLLSLGCCEDEIKLMCINVSLCS